LRQGQSTKVLARGGFLYNLFNNLFSLRGDGSVSFKFHVAVASEPLGGVVASATTRLAARPTFMKYAVGGRRFVQSEAFTLSLASRRSWRRSTSLCFPTVASD